MNKWPLRGAAVCVCICIYIPTHTYIRKHTHTEPCVHTHMANLLVEILNVAVRGAVFC